MNHPPQPPVFPYFYIFFVVIDITKRRLLPPAGNKTRSIALFFIGVTTIFLLVWVPTILFTYLGDLTPTNFIVIGSASHSQGALTAGFTLLRPDIRQAFRDFLCCRREEWSRDEMNEEPEVANDDHGNDDYDEVPMGKESSSR